MLARVVEAEQLVRVPVLLVVVDQAGVRRRGDDAVERRVVLDAARVAVQHPRGTPLVAYPRELLDPRERVECVPA